MPTVEALPTTEPREYIWWPSTVRLLSAVDWYKKKENVHG